MLIKFSVLVPLVTRQLTRRGYKHAMAQLPTSRLKRVFPSTKNNHRILTGCARAMYLVEKHSPFPGTCLARAIILQSTLTRYGLQAAMRIGVKKTAKTMLAAHAWVEVSGQPVNAPADIARMYAPFAESDLTPLLNNPHNFIP